MNIIIKDNFIFYYSGINKNNLYKYFIIIKFI